MYHPPIIKQTSLWQQIGQLTASVRRREINRERERAESYIYVEVCVKCFSFEVFAGTVVRVQTHSLRGEGAEECRGVKRGEEGERIGGEGLRDGGQSICNLGE